MEIVYWIAFVYLLIASTLGFAYFFDTCERLERKQGFLRTLLVAPKTHIKGFGLGLLWPKTGRGMIRSFIESRSPRF